MDIKKTPPFCFYHKSGVRYSMARYSLTALITTCALLCASTNLTMGLCKNGEDLNDMYLRQSEIDLIQSTYDNAVAKLSNGQQNSQNQTTWAQSIALTMSQAANSSTLDADRQQKLNRINMLLERYNEITKKYAKARQILGYAVYDVTSTPPPPSPAVKEEALCRMDSYYRRFQDFFLGYLCSITRNCSKLPNAWVSRKHGTSPAEDESIIFDTLNSNYQNCLYEYDKIKF